MLKRTIGLILLILVSACTKSPDEILTRNGGKWNLAMVLYTKSYVHNVLKENNYDAKIGKANFVGNNMIISLAASTVVDTLHWDYISSTHQIKLVDNNNNAFEYLFAIKQERNTMQEWVYSKMNDVDDSTKKENRIEITLSKY